MSIYIRRMREEDIPQVVEIENIAFSRPWSKSIFKAALLLPYAAYYVAVEQSEYKPQGGMTAAQKRSEATIPCGIPAAQNTLKDLLSEGDRKNGIGEKIVGMCGVKKIFEEGDISNVAVHPDYRGRGISRQMLDMLMREAREDGVTAFTLEVRAGNRPAICLYESYGFRTEGIRPRFYEDPVEDGLVMWLR